MPIDPLCAEVECTILPEHLENGNLGIYASYYFDIGKQELLKKLNYDETYLAKKGFTLWKSGGEYEYHRPIPENQRVKIRTEVEYDGGYYCTLYHQMFDGVGPETRFFAEARTKYCLMDLENQRLVKFDSEFQKKLNDAKITTE